MYSLYRAWLLREPPSANTPPDVLLEVGPSPTTRFVAHGALLGAHSGYLRAALGSRPPPHYSDAGTLDKEPPRLGQDRSNLEPDNGAYSQYGDPIFIPNVTSEQFAPLLTYMYTGYLDLNLDNIFTILLATHVLHMPRALEICRAFLAQNQTGSMAENPSFRIGNVIKPIPSKKVNYGGVYGFGTPQTFPPLYHSLFQSSQNTPFRSLESEKTTMRHPEPEPHLEPIREQPAVPSTSHVDKVGNSETRMPGSDQSVHRFRRTESARSARSKRKPTSPDVRTKIRKTAHVVSVSTASADSETVITDIACCDGPVRFKKVLNNAYGVCTAAGQSKVIKESNRTQIDSSFNVQMAENIKNFNEDENRDSDEGEDINIEDINSDEKSTNEDMVQSENIVNEVIYTCTYCKHTFKSQYCYQKHARRHIHPLEVVDAKDEATPFEDDGKREVRPLDMNVQYYPCKTCGSKFPSYYFVHKHRKMCHAEQDAAPATATATMSPPQ